MLAVAMCSTTAEAIVYVWNGKHNTLGAEDLVCFDDCKSVARLPELVERAAKEDLMLYVDLRPPSRAEGHSLCVWFRGELFQVRDGFLCSGLAR